MPKSSNSTIFGVMMLSLLLVSCESQHAAAPQPEIRPVRAQQVQLKKLTKPTSYSGEVKARYVTDLAFRVAGKLVERKVDVGAVVKKGQLLARIDPTDYKLSVLSSTAQVNSAQADVDKAHADLARYKNLLEKGAVSRTEFDHYQNIYNTATAKLKQTKALLDVDANKANYTDLFADADGVITEILAERGEVVAQGQAILRLARPQEKEISINVSENRLDELNKATELSINLWAYPQLKLRGKIREISPNADPVTRTYNVRVSLLNPPEEAHLGMTATVVLQRTTIQAVALLPLTALYAQGDKPSVWIVDPQTHQVKLTAVQLSEFYGNYVTVIQGLNDGQWVVTAGTHKLHEGQKVRLLDEPKQKG
jgi:membrane fusion protein, multidrug efflux system